MRWDERAVPRNRVGEVVHVLGKGSTCWGDLGRGDRSVRARSRGRKRQGLPRALEATAAGVYFALSGGKGAGPGRGSKVSWEGDVDAREQAEQLCQSLSLSLALQGILGKFAGR